MLLRAALLFASVMVMAPARVRAANWFLDNLRLECGFGAYLVGDAVYDSAVGFDSEWSPVYEEARFAELASAMPMGWGELTVPVSSRTAVRVLLSIAVGNSQRYFLSDAGERLTLETSYKVVVAGGSYGVRLPVGRRVLMLFEGAALARFEPIEHAIAEYSRSAFAWRTEGLVASAAARAEIALGTRNTVTPGASVQFRTPEQEFLPEATLGWQLLLTSWFGLVAQGGFVFTTREARIGGGVSLRAWRPFPYTAEPQGQ
jgi:hypothetical protein